MIILMISPLFFTAERSDARAGDVDASTAASALASSAALVRFASGSEMERMRRCASTSASESAILFDVALGAAIPSSRSRFVAQLAALPPRIGVRIVRVALATTLPLEAVEVRDRFATARLTPLDTDGGTARADVSSRPRFARGGGGGGRALIFRIPLLCDDTR